MTNFFLAKLNHMIPFIKGTEAAEVGMVKEVVPHTNLMTRAQVMPVPYSMSVYVGLPGIGHQCISLLPGQ